MKIRRTGCCGMLELVDISKDQMDASKILDVAVQMLPNYVGIGFNYALPSFIIFTGVVGRKTRDHASGRTDNYGQNLSDFIKEGGYGEVHDDAPEGVNYSGNTLKIWVWKPNYPALLKRKQAMLEIEASRTANSIMASTQL